MATDIPAGFAQERDPASFTSGASVINAPQEATEQETAFQINGYYLAEVTRNFSGGARVGSAYLGNYGLRGTADLEKAVGWKGATSALYVQGTHGETPSDLVGSRQVTSSIQAPDNTARVYELWLQQVSQRTASLFSAASLI
jgi:porin